MSSNLYVCCIEISCFYSILLQTCCGLKKLIFHIHFRKKTLRPDSTTAKFFARNCLWVIRMIGHEWFYWILSLFSPSQWVELNSTHWRSKFFAREERIQWNYSCATIRTSHKQFLAKYFAVVESGLYTIRNLIKLYKAFKQLRWCFSSLRVMIF